MSAQFRTVLVLPDLVSYSQVIPLNTVILLAQ